MDAARRPRAVDIAALGGARQIPGMAAPILDFSHLTPDERIELAEQLWDSIEPADVVPDEAQVEELRRRRAALAADGAPGEPWRAVLDGIAQHGA